jgi:hypothetical protein
MSSATATSIQSLFQTARTPVDPDKSPTEVILVNVKVDDSASIRFASKADAVRDGVNMVAESLMKTKQTDGIFESISYINGTTLCPFVNLKDVPKLDMHNYNPMGGTPLYDQMLVALGATVAKTQEYADNGVPVRSITCMVTDGMDEGSTRATANDVEKVVKSMLMTESHIVACIGIDNGSCDFRQVFKSMGIPDEWVLVVDGTDPKTAAHNIREAFRTVSQSVVRASQNQQTFSQTAMGGFASGNP